MTPILILAAGASSRMRGRDKLLMDVDGRPLLTRQVSAALSVSRDVRVALPTAPHPRHACVAAPARRVEVRDAAEGIGASLRGLISTLEPAISHALILLADLPDITGADMAQVMAARIDHPEARLWRGATQDGRPGHPILLSASLFPEFAQLTGDTGGQHILSRHQDATHLVPLPGDRARRDLDTPEEWAAWRAANAVE